MGATATRDTEVTSVCDALSRGARVLVRGDEGVGKTYLLDRIDTRRSDDGVPTIRVTGAAASRDVPLGPFAALLGPLPDLGPSDLGVTALAARVIDRIRSDARAGLRAVVLVDDADLLDDASVQLLAQLEEGVVVVGRPDRPWSEAFRRLTRDATTIELLPLGRAATATLASQVLGAPLDAAGRAELWRLSRGVPLVAVEILRWWRAEGVAVPGDGGEWHLTTTRTPPRLDHLVSDRVAALDELAAVLLESVVVGGEVPARVAESAAATATGASPAAASRALEALESTGLVTSRESGTRIVIRAAHPLAEVTVRARLTPLRTRTRLAALVEALAEAGTHHRGDAARLAAWSHAAGLPVDPERLGVRARQLLGEFAAAVRGDDDRGPVDDEEARRRDALGMAAAAWRDRPSMGTGYAYLVALLEEPGRAEEFAGVLAETRPLASSGFEATSLDVLEALWRFWTLGDHAGAVAGLDEATGRATPGQVTRLRCFEGNLDTAAGFVSMGAAVLDAHEPPATAPTHLVVLHGTATAANRLWSGRVEEALLWADRVEDAAAAIRDETSIALGELAQVRIDALAVSGRPAEAEAVAATMLDAAAASGSDTSATTFHGAIAALRLRAGEIDRAITGLVDTLAVHPPGRTIDYSARARSTLAVAHTCRGDLAAAEVALADARASLRGPRVFTVDVDVAAAVVAVAAARTDLAATTVRDGLAREQSRGGALGALLLAHVGAAIVDAATFAPDVAAAAGGVDGPVASAVARHAGALAERDAAALEQAAAALHDLGLGLWAHLCWRQAAAVHRGEGRRTAASRAERAAAGLLDALPGLPWSEQTRAAVSPAIGTLTRREADVVALAGRGWTSAAIADELGVSVRTVESHLYRAFAKLGVESRAELRALVAQG